MWTRMATLFGAAMAAFCLVNAAVYKRDVGSVNVKATSSLVAKASRNGMVGRRRALNSFIKGPLVAAGLSRIPIAKGEQNEQVDVYFGCGCFWHVQHEFVDLEKKLLGRWGADLTSIAGYAGGKSRGSEGKVCYHNLRQLADYGRLGHAEVVGMRIPLDNLHDFAKRYFELFVKYELPGVTIIDRADPQDKGSEYRSLLGLPEGMKSPHFKTIQNAAIEVLGPTWSLAEGRGNEPDTLLQKRVYVMDSKKFPFFAAEPYHQFHNDFQSPPYGKEYNSLKTVLMDASKIRETGCPGANMI